ncbi:MAG: TetR family transcriptional regulator [Nocardia sp.]|nr:TetR family transcriptional regulator [Nocardia sp.]
MIERDYDRITVQDILDRADIGRSTFYSHFRDKDDLLVVSGTEFLRTAVAEGTGDPIRTVFDLADEHREVYRALLGRKSTMAVLRGTQHMFAEILADQGIAEPDRTFVSWGMVGLLADVAEGRISAAEGYAVVHRTAIS